MEQQTYSWQSNSKQESGYPGNRKKTMKDIAQFVKILLPKYYEAEVIRLVSDNLNIHKEKSFYETFSEDEAKRLWKR